MGGPKGSFSRFHPTDVCAQPVVGAQREETTLTIREDLQCLVAELGDEQATEALDYIRWLVSGGDTLTDYELVAMHQGEREIADGEYVRLEELGQTLGA